MDALVLALASRLPIAEIARLFGVSAYRESPEGGRA
jgi:hypothetical protein